MEFDHVSREFTEEKKGSRLWTIYFPYWPLISAILVIALVAAWIYLKYSSPVYESKATILVKDEKKGVDDSRMLASLDLISSNNILENEIEVLRSNQILGKVVERLLLYAPVYREGAWGEQSAYVSSPIKIELKNPSTLKETDKIHFAYNSGNKTVMAENQMYPLNVWVDTKWGAARFIPNRNFEGDANTSKFFFKLYSVQRIIEGLSHELDVSPTSKTSTMITLTLANQVPSQSEDILNEIIVEYNRRAIEDKNKLAANALSFVEERLRYIVGELDSVETAIQQFKKEKGVVDISEQGKRFLESVQNNDNKISEINGSLAVIAQIEKYVKNKDERSGMVPSTLGLQDPLLSQLLSKLYEAEIEYERLRKTTGQNNTVLSSIRKQIETIKPSILENIENQKNTLLASKEILTGTSARYSSLIRTIPENERKLLDITRQQSIKNNIYTFLLQKREEAALSFGASAADSRLIDKAQTKVTPISPRRGKIYSLAFLMGIGLPIGLLFIRNSVNGRVQVVNDISQIASFPILGEINCYKDENSFLMLTDDAHPVANQIRQIRTSLTYLGLKESKNKILISSSRAGEGKTFVAINLAISLALTDKKVALIELDLRKPSLAKLFKLNASLGVADYLKKRVGEEEIIFPTDVNPNLYLIPSGETPAYPSELISNGKLQTLFKYLEDRYDYIIVETAPIRPVIDGYILSRLCDATLFIVRQDKSLKEDLRWLEHNNKIRGLRNIAIIFNGVRSLPFSSERYDSQYLSRS